jgi:tetratricopeptide (TPR) repeat protein
MKDRLILLMIMVLSGFAARGTNTLPDSAKVYFEQGEFEKAIRIWHNAAHDYPVAGLYYNSGLAYNALGQRGNAIYNFEQALRLKPWSRQIQKALRTTRESIRDAVVPVNPFFLASWYAYLLAFLRPGQWALLGLVCILAATIQYVSMNQVLRIKPFLHGRIPLYSLIAGFCLVLVAFLSYYRLAASHHAMIQETCALYQGATADSPVLRSLEVGEKVTITDEIGDWKYVKLANLDNGWVQQPCIKIISIPGY